MNVKKTTLMHLLLCLALGLLFGCIAAQPAQAEKRTSTVWKIQVIDEARGSNLEVFTYGGLLVENPAYEQAFNATPITNYGGIVTCPGRPYADAYDGDNPEYANPNRCFAFKNSTLEVVAYAFDWFRQCEYFEHANAFVCHASVMVRNTLRKERDYADLNGSEMRYWPASQVFPTAAKTAIHLLHCGEVCPTNTKCISDWSMALCPNETSEA
jgi:hypothetical protein